MTELVKKISDLVNIYSCDLSLRKEIASEHYISLRKVSGIGAGLRGVFSISMFCEKAG